MGKDIVYSEQFTTNVQTLQKSPKNSSFSCGACHNTMKISLRLFWAIGACRKPFYLVGKVTTECVLPLKVLEKVALGTHHPTGGQVIWEDCVDIVVANLMSPILRNLYSFLFNMCI